MKIKETICTEFDGRGKPIRRTCTVDVIDSETSQEYDEEQRAEISGIHRASVKRINEAIEDYYRAKEW